MAEKSCVEDIGDDEDIGLCYLEVLALVKLEYICLEISSLSLTIGLPDSLQKPISNRSK